MDFNDINSWQGDTIPIVVTKPDTTAISAKLLIGTVGEAATYSKSALYGTDNLAVLTITGANSNVFVKYE